MIESDSKPSPDDEHEQEEQEQSGPESDVSLTDGIGGLDELLLYLNESRGFDFSGYKRAGLERRVSKRVFALGLKDFGEYVDYLQVHPEEFAHLFNSILINATGFFRDPSAWETITKRVVPQLLEGKAHNSAIRVWCAGCATGQEAYTMAMILAQALGMERFSRRVKIYATDIDDDALSQARQATYSQKEVGNLPAGLLELYFEPIGSKFAVLKELRRSVIFGKHNLFFDAPISKIDLLSCRNTLMYFNAESQARILSSLHFALSDSGVLFLGKAEMLLTHSSLFAPLELKSRLFTKVTHNHLRLRGGNGMAAHIRQHDTAAALEQQLLRQGAFDSAPVAQLAFDRQNVLRVANEPARRVLGLLQSDLGRPVQDLLLSRRVAGLPASLEQATQEARTVQLPMTEWLRGLDDPLFFDISVTPLLDPGGGPIGIQLSFTDVTALRRSQSELQRSTLELEGAYEELQSTGEELETTNEELQSTVEELETTNEELQSTNEELETTNEELQSTNEELQSMNEELRLRTGALAQVNLYFESILASLRSAVVVLDLELRVQVWSHRAQELWGLRLDEVIGKHLLNLDIGLPVAQLTPVVRACVNADIDYEELTLSATNRRGRAITCNVLVSRLTQDKAARGVILLMDDRDANNAEAS